MSSEKELALHLATHHHKLREVMARDRREGMASVLATLYPEDQEELALATEEPTLQGSSLGETWRTLKKAQQAKLAQIERKRAFALDDFTHTESTFLEAKQKLREAERKLDNDFASEEAAKKKFDEKLAKEEEFVRKKLRAMSAQAGKAAREVARLERMEGGEEERRQELECPVCMEEMVPPTQIYGVSKLQHYGISQQTWLHLSCNLQMETSPEKIK